MPERLFYYRDDANRFARDKADHGADVQGPFRVGGGEWLVTWREPDPPRHRDAAPPITHDD